MYTLEQLEPFKEILRFAPREDIVDYLVTQPDFKTAWENCNQGDWMLSIARKLGVSERTLVLANSLCAKTVYHLMSKGAKKAVDIFERYGCGKATDKERSEGILIANLAYLIADSKNPNNTFLEHITNYCACAAVAYDFYAVLSSAKATYYYAKSKGLDPEKAKAENLAKTADICREILTKEVFEILQIN